MWTSDVVVVDLAELRCLNRQPKIWRLVQARGRLGPGAWLKMGPRCSGSDAKTRS